MAARNTEVSQPKDTTVDSKFHQPPTAVPEKLTSDLLAGISTLPKAPEARGLHPVPIDGAPNPSAPAAGSTEVAAVKPNPRAAVDAPAPPQAAAPDAAMKTLQSPDASSAEKIAAISKIYDSMPKNKHGDVEITMKDGDKDKKFVISKEDIGHGVKLTHLNYEGPDHRMHPVLRGVERNGRIEQEQDKHGHKADFQGDWWSKNSGGSTIGQFSDSPAAPTPPQRPEEVPLPPRRPDNGTEQTPPPPPERDHRHREPAPPSHEQQEQPHHKRHGHEGQTGPGEQKQEPHERDQTHKKPHHKTEDRDQKEQPSKESVGPAHVRGNGTAVYDIAHHTVTLPDGSRLEAHSGLGRNKDNPDSVGLHNIGATPKGYYDLSIRGGLFHGVEALRLNPTDSRQMHGRGGILAHTYMLRNPGDSNGCVVFKNYPAFLRAYKSGEIKHIEVV